MPMAQCGPEIALNVRGIRLVDRDGGFLTFAERLEATLGLKIDYEARL